jgi:hypothetical protein
MPSTRDEKLNDPLLFLHRQAMITKQHGNGFLTSACSHGIVYRGPMRMQMETPVIR